MNELIKTQQHESGQILVSGRDLHEFLEVATPYSMWIERMIDYGFSENEDFITKMLESTGGRKSQDHLLKVDMAKEISMLQRNEKGKQARQYFIEVEKRWNSPEMIIKRAHELLEQKVATLTTTNLLLTQQNNELQPKASYYDLVLQNKSLLSVTKIAKDYGMGAPTFNKLLNEHGVQYKQGDIWLLYAKYQDQGYTQTTTHVIDADKSRISTKWTQKGRLFLYDLLKSHGILPTIETQEVG